MSAAYPYYVRRAIAGGTRVYQTGSGLNAVSFDPNEATHVRPPCGPTQGTVTLAKGFAYLRFEPVLRLRADMAETTLSTIQAAE